MVGAPMYERLPDGIERRSEDRDPFTKRFFDLHFGLSRRHDDLDRRVGILSVSVQQLAESQTNNHKEVMGLLNNIYQWTRCHERADRKTANLQMLGIMSLLVLLTWLVVKVAPL